VVGDWWVLVVVLHLGASVGSFSLVASSMLFSGLEHGGRLMLGKIDEGYLFPNKGLMDKCEGTGK
jgi:hypothetical protein